MNPRAAARPPIQMFGITCTTYANIPQHSPTVQCYIFNLSTRIKFNYKNIHLHVLFVWLRAPAYYSSWRVKPQFVRCFLGCTFWLKRREHQAGKERPRNQSCQGTDSSEVVLKENGHRTDFVFLKVLYPRLTAPIERVCPPQKVIPLRDAFTL